jgi:hypothetical protein
MKTIQKCIVALLLVVAGTAKAQVSVNVNIGASPSWGPVGYTDVRYYYMPEMGIYYDINTANYIYPNRGTWVRARVLPAPYRTVNLYNTYKVVLTDYRGNAPYIYYKTHKVKYPKYYHPRHQKTIGVPPDHAKKMVAGHRHGKAKGHGHHGKGHKH